MLKVTVGPIHCCMSFYPCLYREDLILVLFYTNIFFIPSVTTIRRSQYSGPCIKRTTYKADEWFNFCVKRFARYLLWAYCKTNPLIADTCKGRVCVQHSFHRTWYFLVIDVHGSGVGSYTRALSEWFRTHQGCGLICCNRMKGRKLHYCLGSAFQLNKQILTPIVILRARQLHPPTSNWLFSVLQDLPKAKLKCII